MKFQHFDDSQNEIKYTCENPEFINCLCRKELSLNYKLPVKITNLSLHIVMVKFQNSDETEIDIEFYSWLFL